MLLIILWFIFFSITIDASWMISRGCNEALTSPVGVLQFTDTYKDLESWTLYCEYNITVEESKKILVTTLSLSMHSSVDCEDSYISLIDGLTGSLSPLGNKSKYCNHKHAGSLRTTGNELGIRSAIQLGRGAHYLLKYQELPLTCGDLFQLTPRPLRQTVQVRDSASDCIWVFIAASDRLLTMEAPNCDNEHLEIRDGGTELSPLISESCPIPGQKISTTRNLLYMKLRSMIPRRDFVAHIEVVDRPCGGTLRLRDGVIASPDYTLNSGNKICNWKVIVPENKRIAFQFHDLHLPDSLDCEKRDYVRISERGPGTGNSRALGTFCGSIKPDTTITSCNKATIQFYSDYHNIGHFRGFILNFTTIEVPCSNECGGTLTSDSGMMSSPNFPKDYDSNQHCEWTIKLSPLKRIKFQFFGVMIDNSPSCREDYLQIKETINGRERNLGVYCNDSDPAPIVTSSSEARVIFHSDYQHEDSGFQLAYSAIEESSLGDDYSHSSKFLPPLDRGNGTHSRRCGGILTHEHGVIQSPHYPAHYAGNERCLWTVKAPPGHTVKLTWSFFKTEVQNDYVMIEEEDKNGLSVNIGRFCGHNLPPTIVTRSNILIVMFHSDSTVNMGGFSAKYFFT